MGETELNKCNIITIGLLIIVLMMGVSGCMFGSETKLEQTKSEILNHMKEKYGVDFLPISLATRGIDVSYDEFRCYVEGTNKETDFITVCRKGTGKDVYYEDNYFGLLVREEYESRIAKVCKMEFENISVFSKFRKMYFNDDLGVDSSLDDAFAIGERMSTFTEIFIEVRDLTDAQIESKCKSVINSIENQYNISVKIYCLSPGHLKQINRSNFRDYLDSYFKPDGIVCIKIYGE